MQGIWPISADEQATNFFMRSAEAAGYFDWGYSLGAPPAIAEFVLHAVVVVELF